ncbi:MAG TPA: TadE/TadG family type IV pilus assembly protein [Novosphingobium sp.]
MNGANTSYNALARDVRGNVLPLAAIGMVLSAALIGGGIDMGRAYRAENRLQAACDAGVLAGRRAVESNGYTAAAQKQASNYFFNNFDQTRQEARDTVFTSTSEENGNVINGTATAKVNTAVMKIFGFKDFDLSVECTASMGVGNSDVVMVLDTTGSMAGTGIAALQTAVKNFYDTVQNSTAGTNARIRYGFVPYSQSVNVGGLLQQDWIADIYDVQSRVAQWNWVDGTPTTSYNTVTKGPETLHPAYAAIDYTSKKKCEADSYVTTTAWANQGSASAPRETITQSEVPQSRTTAVDQDETSTVYYCKQVGNVWKRYQYVQTRTKTTTTPASQKFASWIYRKVSYDVSKYKAGQSVTTNTGTNGAKVTSTWAGCIEERKTSPEALFTYSTITGMTPYTWDLDIDTVPDLAKPDSQWHPMWPEVAYYRALGTAEKTSGTKAGFACPRAAQLLRTMDEGEFDAYADSLVAVGSTYLDIGLLWGARLSSPDGIFADNVTETPDNGGEVSRHIIFMTDGDMDPQPNTQAPYGIEQNDFRVTNDGTDTTATARHNVRFRAICAAIKAKGIRIWAISFRVALSTDMKNCASANSAYNATSSAALNTAFQEIAKQVGELRVTQ